MVIILVKFKTKEIILKKTLFLILLFTFSILFLKTEVKANTYEESESFLKILTKDELKVTSEFTYQKDDKTYVKLDLLLNNDILPFDSIEEFDFLTRKKVKKIDYDLYLDTDSIKKIFKMNYSYDVVTNTLYYGDVKETSELLEDLLDKTDYSENDFMWLSKIIYAEGRGENYQSQLGVGNVIMNRVNSPSYPNTIYEVVFDRKFGVQFSPVLDGSIYNDSNIECMAVAMDVLLNINNCGDALFFMNPDIAETSWISENRKHLVSYGNHSFYA